MKTKLLRKLRKKARLIRLYKYEKYKKYPIYTIQFISYHILDPYIGYPQIVFSNLKTAEINLLKHRRNYILLELKKLREIREKKKYKYKYFTLINI